MAISFPQREQDYGFKSFTLDDYLKDDAPFKIGLEFEKSDREIRRHLEKAERPVSLLNALFFGYTLIGINGSYPLGDIGSKEKEKYAVNFHPLVHFDSIITSLKERLTSEPDYAHFLDHAEEYFFGFPEDRRKAERFHDLYEVARNTGFRLNLAILSPNEDDVSLIWYDPRIKQVQHQEASKELFQKKVIDLGSKIIGYMQNLKNIDRSNAYQRLINL